MLPLGWETGDQVPLNPVQFAGIPLALIAAVFLSLGAQFQHRGVAKVEANATAPSEGAVSVRQLLLLLSRPSWMLGTLLLGLAVVLQLGSLYFSPLIVVQPIGAVALVITTYVNSRLTKVQLPMIAKVAVGMCVGGIGVFVGIAATVASDQPVRSGQLVVILLAMAVVLCGAAVCFGYWRQRLRTVVYVLLAGVLYGFVATLAKVVLARLQHGHLEWLTFACLVGLVVAAVLGGYFVQNAHANGPPDLVIAGLTVVDPLVAITIGIVVLHEAAHAGPVVTVAFLLSALVAIIGVLLLARYHPQARLAERFAADLSD